MSADPGSRVPQGRHHRSSRRPWCPACRSDAHLIIESIQSLTPPVPGLVGIEYSCAACKSCFAHPATVQQIAKVLNDAEHHGGMLRFGNHYIHCGEPMAVTGVESVRWEAEVSDPPGSAPLATIALSTRILRCRCGFRLDVPT